MTISRSVRHSPSSPVSRCSPCDKRTPFQSQNGADGAKEQNRTADTAVFSRVLYLLSYLGRHPVGWLVGETGLEPVTSSV